MRVRFFRDFAHDGSYRNGTIKKLPIICIEQILADLKLQQKPDWPESNFCHFKLPRTIQTFFAKKKKVIDQFY